MNYLSKVGFEIEGGWEGKPGISPFPDITLIPDHSINGQTLTGTRIAPAHLGEAVSPPIDVNDMEGDPPVPSWERWLLTHWPNAAPPHRTNNTCGFHIHVSLRDFLSYSLLTSRVFLFELRDALQKEGEQVKLPPKHAFWSRMAGLNTFCQLLSDPARQMKLTHKAQTRDRYGFLNFAYGIHQTVEFRALPTFRDAQIGVRFARLYLNFTDKWLTVNQPSEPLVRRETFSL